MPSFISLVWDTKNDAATFHVASWRQTLKLTSEWGCIYEAHGLVVYTHRSRSDAASAYLLREDGGVVLGRIFHADADCSYRPAAPTLTSQSSRQILSSAGRVLLTDYWGMYIAFIRDEARDRVFIIRDCSGRLPCYRTEQAGVSILFSDIADLTPLNLPQFKINSKYVAAFILDTEIQIGECGLTGVTEVLAGETLEFRRGAIRQFSLWKPSEIYRNYRMENYAEAAHLLRLRTKNCVRAWSEVFKNILLRLSGGLDSSIVLSCLARSHPSLTCLNLYDTTPGADERTYARLAARAAQASLVERQVASAGPVFNANLYELPRTTKPLLPPILLGIHEAATNEVARSCRADAIWTGQGGDHLFFQSTDELGAADYKFHHRWSRAALRAIVDAAHLSRKPYLHVLTSAWRHSRRSTRWDPRRSAPEQIGFVERDAVPNDLDQYMTHPWMSDLDGLPVGKQSQLFDLARIVHRERPSSAFGNAFEHHPLLSQPLIELCVSTPTYLLTRGGRDRAMARDAFRKDLPPEIYRREDKGDATFTVADSIRRDVKFLRDLLLDGVLIREGILSARHLGAILDQRQAIRELQFIPLLACIAAELWVRNWQSEHCLARSMSSHHAD